MTAVERFAAYMARHCTSAQLAVVRDRTAAGWRPFKVCGTVAAPVVLMSQPTGVRSNIAPSANHCRVHHDGLVVRYTPRGRH